jgi:hypothetical protein
MKLTIHPGSTRKLQASKYTIYGSEGIVCPYEMATAHAVLGDKTKALAWLDKGLRERSGCMPDLKVDPRLESLRSESKFNEILRRVGF